MDDDYGRGMVAKWRCTRGLKGVVFGIGRFERELLCGLAWIFEPFSSGPVSTRGFLRAADSILLSFASGEALGRCFFQDAFKFLIIEVFWGKRLEKLLNRNKFSSILRIERVCGSIKI